MAAVWNRWGSPVGNLVAAGILIGSVLFIVAAVIFGVGLVLRAWAFMMGA